ncbi:hypothetical protein QBC38DRAFT_286789 [Podospora fimiseda]|uniref:BHLH domain-containing protein n=1 Tax=Podospora fimiseda TaxID=252190 RepID=A0AAN7BK04_9PEZI|nr:hypothetical protein QBC38DRAFT_286789 [Podospora fimiseda]
MHNETVYQRPVVDHGLLSPSYLAMPAPVIPFNQVGSTTASADGTWFLESPSSAGNGVGYFGHLSDDMAFPDHDQTQTEWEGSSAYMNQGQGHNGYMYPTTTGLSPTFVGYDPPQTEPANAPPHQLKNTFITDEKHRVSKKKAGAQQSPGLTIQTFQLHPAPIEPCPAGFSPPPPPPLPTPPVPTRAALRKAPRKSCPPADTSPRPGESVENHQLRTIHNQVEQKYRLRVQSGFEKLIEVLPSDTDGEEPNSIRKPSRRLSKADVLAKTTSHVVSMGEENKRLKKELEEARAQMAVYQKKLGDD